MLADADYEEVVECAERPDRYDHLLAEVGQRIFEGIASVVS